MAGLYNDHGSTVWRVCWNVTGTILATAGDDGQVRLWKANYMVKPTQGACTNHVDRILGYFDPPPPMWTLLLNKAYVMKWSFG